MAAGHITVAAGKVRGFQVVGFTCYVLQHNDNFGMSLFE
jgi:hypothetical protein